MSHTPATMSYDQFSKLFKYMRAEFKKLRQELESTRFVLRSDIDGLYGLLDKQLKQQEIDEHERLVMHRQLNRHERGIARASPRVGISYKL